jgi:hypothetical protein
MPSEIVINRLNSILNMLTAARQGGADVSTPTMGRERELFINMVVSNIISVPFRIGSGDIVDRNNNLSRQADIVIEYSNTLSFPSVYPHSERLYLAESVCAVIEVKSTLSEQWRAVVKAATALHRLDREPGAVGYVGEEPPKKIPFFVVGYSGWQDSRTARSNLDEVNREAIRDAAVPAISGILQIDPCFFVGAGRFQDHSFDGARGLFGLLLSIEQLTSAMLSSKPPFKGYVE